MPITPQFEWDQGTEDVHIHVTLKGFKKDSVDVFISDLFVKVNAHPTYLLALDLLHEINPDKSSFYFEEVVSDAGDAVGSDGADGRPAIANTPTEASTSGRALRLHVKLAKVDSEQLWEALCLKGSAMPKRALMERRTAAMQRAEAQYNKKLETRQQQREIEKRRMQDAQWEVEKTQRQTIERRVQAEKREAESDLYAWEDATRTMESANAPTSEQAPITKMLETPSSSPQPQSVPKSPADILAMSAQPTRASTSTAGTSPSVVPVVRQTETVNVTIDFTPKVHTVPTRSRGDEEYYRRSRYKPVSVEDSPVFWKHQGDTLYKAHDWRGAANAYSESIKRDGVFLTCVMNRAACFLHLCEYKRAIEDCTLALTLLSNTPASECTQDRYRHLMTRLHARRGAAYCWSDDIKAGAQDLRMAAAYADPQEDADVLRDLELVESLMKDKGIQQEEADPLAVDMQSAAGFYYKGEYDAAEALYRKILTANAYHTQARNNLIAVLLHQKRFKPALEECQRVIEFCQEVAEALNQPDYLDTVDSDDEDEPAVRATTSGGDDQTAGAGAGVDEHVRQRRAATKKALENSGHVYVLLKAYVRGAAALCGLKQYREAHAWLEKALRITPYDNDLLDDCNRVAEKLRMETLLAATTSSRDKSNTHAPADASNTPVLSH